MDPFTWVHLMWSLNVFLFQVLNWWILYRWNKLLQGISLLIHRLLALESKLRRDAVLRMAGRGEKALASPPSGPPSPGRRFMLLTGNSP